MDRPRDPDLAARLFGASPERALALMRCAWPAAVGPELARRTEVVSFDAGQLRVRVPDATWQRSLWRMRGDILARLRAIAGRAAPRTLGFVQGAVAAELLPEKPAPPPSVEPPRSLVAAAAAAIPDDALRAAFLAAAGRYLGRFSSSADGTVTATASAPAASPATGEGSTASPGAGDTSPGPTTGPSAIGGRASPKPSTR